MSSSQFSFCLSLYLNKPKFLSLFLHFFRSLSLSFQQFHSNCMLYFFLLLLLLLLRHNFYALTHAKEYTTY